MLHHTINITSTEAELFALRCGINQAIQITDSSCIIVITDALHVAKKIFDPSIHPYQLQMIAISKKLQEFFNKHLDNSIEFWDYPSDENWRLHASVDKETKKFNLTPIYPCKMLWESSRSSGKLSECQGSRGKNFLNLLNNDRTIIKPSYMKGGPGSSNLVSQIHCALRLLKPSLITLL